MAPPIRQRSRARCFNMDSFLCMARRFFPLHLFHASMSGDFSKASWAARNAATCDVSGDLTDKRRRTTSAGRTTSGGSRGGDCCGGVCCKTNSSTGAARTGVDGAGRGVGSGERAGLRSGSDARTGVNGSSSAGGEKDIAARAKTAARRNATSDSLMRTHFFCNACDHIPLGHIKERRPMSPVHRAQTCPSWTPQSRLTKQPSMAMDTQTSVNWLQPPPCAPSQTEPAVGMSRRATVPQPKTTSSNTTTD